MAHVFALTDGTTTISLVASSVYLENYDLKVPQDDDKQSLTLWTSLLAARRARSCRPKRGRLNP
jgi:hypothetical protein